MRRTLIVLALAGFSVPPGPARAEREPPSASIAPPPSFRDRWNRGQVDAMPPSSTSAGWWLGPAGVAAAIAVWGGVSLLQKRLLPLQAAGSIQVVGRASLSPRQSVFLVRVGDRVLILGAGTQGPPTSLGEVTDAAELARLAPRRPPSKPAGPAVAVGPPPVPASRPSISTFDRRIGDDDE